MLSKIWKQQKEYNKKIFKIEGEEDPHFWTQTYLLGLADQISEVLKEIRWKRHRRENGKKVVPLNVLEEIADITKFAISMAQVWGFSEKDLLNAVYEKGEILDFKLSMEFAPPLKGKKILITDVDGTLADYKQSFTKWLIGQGMPGYADVMDMNSVLLDSALDINYPDYYMLKERYEESGGYRDLIPYPDVHNALWEMKRLGYHIIVVTSRPAHVYKRIFKDTLYWFNKLNFPIDELHMLGSGRILLACDLVRENDVVLWDDDPNILMRASKSNIHSFARKHSYNENLNLYLVTILDAYFNGR